MAFSTISKFGKFLNKIKQIVVLVIVKVGQFFDCHREGVFFGAKKNKTY